MGILKSLYGILGLRSLRKKLVTIPKIRFYNHRKERILHEIKQKKHLTVVFFPINVSMWKYDDLVDLLLKNPDISVHIVPLLFPTNNREYNMRMQDEMRAFFTSKGFPYIDGYDFDSDMWFDAKTLNPDIIYYIQPYNVGHRLFKLEHFWDKSLFMYSPYGIVVEYLEGFYNTLFLNIAARLFYPTVFNLEDAKELAYNRGDNVVVTGYPIEDRFFNRGYDFKNVWKQDDPTIKRVIWAPHHSINESDTLNYSTFLQVADHMIELCREYEGKVQFAFKPHPALRTKLYSVDGWGKERTDQYYEEWAAMSNSSLVDGDYVELFRTSDAMIHDCSSFTVEYLYVNRPVMYLSKQGHLEVANELGRRCFDLHYHGETVTDMKAFIDNVVLDGKDTMSGLRASFVDAYLRQRKGTVAENIYNEMLSLLS